MKVEERISELEKELQERQTKLQQDQATVQQEIQTIISINGGLMELKRLQETVKPKKEKETQNGEKDNNH